MKGCPVPKPYIQYLFMGPRFCSLGHSAFCHPASFRRMFPNYLTVSSLSTASTLVPIAINVQQNFIVKLSHISAIQKDCILNKNFQDAVFSLFIPVLWDIFKADQFNMILFDPVLYRITGHAFKVFDTACIKAG